jgi:hypothetical protein
MHCVWHRVRNVGRRDPSTLHGRSVTSFYITQRQSVRKGYAEFEVAVRKFWSNLHAAFILDVFFLCVKMNCNTVLENIYGILLCKNCVYLCIYHWFHILFSDTQINGMYVHTSLSLSLYLSLSGSSDNPAPLWSYGCCVQGILLHLFCSWEKIEQLAKSNIIAM